MEYYLAYSEGYEPQLAWLEERQGARSVHVIAAKPAPQPRDLGIIPDRNMYTTAATIQEALAAHPGLLGKYDRIERYPLKLGQRHPRIWRGLFGARFALTPDERGALTSTATALAILLSDLQKTFQTLEPHKSTQSSFGHRIRQVLMNASTEVENAWKAILKANGYPGDRLQTSDYIRLKKPLRLEEWSVELTHYPGYPPICPFEGWDPSRPTASLPWYEANNKTKHDREANLREARLDHAIASVAGVLVLAAAQFGPMHWATGWGAGPFQQTVMTFRSTPSWSPAELYYDDRDSQAWEFVPLSL